MQRQLYSDLPDGLLAEYREELDEAHEAIIERVEPNAIYTSGPDGYDEHFDHIEVHDSILRVVRRLGATGIVLYALESSHEGQLVVPATPYKLGAMACHESQRVVDDLTRWGDTDAYTPLIVRGETYNLVASQGGLLGAVSC